jgi:thiamine biosynthesis lipoprotein
MSAVPSIDTGLLHVTLSAMNTEVELYAESSQGRQLERAQRWLAAFEARFSRFRTLSELSRLNAADGHRFKASPLLCHLVSLSLGLAKRSAGLFDPTILPDLMAAGYDRSFELIDARRVPPSRRNRGPRWSDVVLDPSTRSIQLPAGVGLDLGGIAKGWAVDRLASMLGHPCLVNGGGDIYAAGRPPNEWRIGVADPFDPENDLATLALTDRGVATSSSLKRRWQSSDLVAHHLIDPRTRCPSTSDAVQVTAIARSATEADYQAKVALLMGVEAGLDHMNREPDVEGLIIRVDGRPFETNRWAAFIERKSCDQE